MYFYISLIFLLLNVFFSVGVSVDLYVALFITGFLFVKNHTNLFAIYFFLLFFILCVLKVLIFVFCRITSAYCYSIENFTFCFFIFNSLSSYNTVRSKCNFCCVQAFQFLLRLRFTRYFISQMEKKNTTNSRFYFEIMFNLIRKSQ